MFYELIFETGAKSVAYYDSDEEMLSAVKNHHTRATKGEDGYSGATQPGERSFVAERVVEVQRYDEHPVDFQMSQMLDAKDVEKQLKAAVEAVSVGGQISIPELAAQVRNMSSPLVDGAGRHESMYKAEANKTFKASEWEATN